MNRSAFLSSSAFATILGASATATESVPGGTHLVERKSDFNAAEFEKLVGKPADIRQMWEAVAFRPAIFNNIKNSLNGLVFGYGYAPERIAMAFCPHGPSSAYTYADEIWVKYKIGPFYKLTDTSGALLTSNVFLRPAKSLNGSADPDDPNSVFQDTSIQTLQNRGVVFLTCHTAVEEQARALVKAGNAPAGMNATDVANDILTHLIPGAHVVPAMVSTVAVLQQRYNYSYLTLVM